MQPDRSPSQLTLEMAEWPCLYSKGSSHSVSSVEAWELSTTPVTLSSTILHPSVKTPMSNNACRSTTTIPQLPSVYLGNHNPWNIKGYVHNSTNDAKATYWGRTDAMVFHTPFIHSFIHSFKLGKTILVSLIDSLCCGWTICTHACAGINYSPLLWKLCSITAQPVGVVSHPPPHSQSHFCSRIKENLLPTDWITQTGTIMPAPFPGM